MIAEQLAVKPFQIIVVVFQTFLVEGIVSCVLLGSFDFQRLGLGSLDLDRFGLGSLDFDRFSFGSFDFKRFLLYGFSFFTSALAFSTDLAALELVPVAEVFFSVAFLFLPAWQLSFSGVFLLTYRIPP